MIDYTNVFGIRQLDLGFYAAHASDYVIMCNDACYNGLHGKVVEDDDGIYYFVMW